MADRPAAEVVVDEPLVRRLLAEQCPEIDGFGRTADLPLELVDEGWDNVMLRLGPSLTVRVPRRSEAAPLVVNEQRWLAVLDEQVDVAVPAPVVAGRPSGEYPWHWSVVPWFAGSAAGTLDRAELRPVAGPLATFFAQLHTPAPAEAPVNAVRGGPLVGRDAAVRERLARIEHPRGAELEAAWRTALETPAWDGPALWLHGDPHPFNIVVSDEATGGAGLSAVVDFGDMTSGDPACDLAAAWLVFDAAGRAAFRSQLDRAMAVRGGDVPTAHDSDPQRRGLPGHLPAHGARRSSWHDEAVWARARGWALGIATALLAHSDDAPLFAALGERTVHELLDDR